VERRWHIGELTRRRALALTGAYLVLRTPLAGEHSPDELKQIAATLKT
jgi:hypothetical protein